MQEQYQVLSSDASKEEVVDWINQVARLREDDILDYTNQITVNPVFYTTVPSSSTDLKGTEKQGDMAAEAGFLYVVVNNAGALAWRRVAISSF
jgi:hypothetical protein